MVIKNVGQENRNETCDGVVRIKCLDIKSEFDALIDIWWNRIKVRIRNILIKQLMKLI